MSLAAYEQAENNIIKEFINVMKIVNSEDSYKVIIYLKDACKNKEGFMEVIANYNALVRE